MEGAPRAGGYLPPDRREPVFERIEASVLDALRAVPSLASTAADILDRMGFVLSVPARRIPMRSGTPPIVGHAVTLRYLPERRTVAELRSASSPSRLANRSVFGSAAAGDVVVVDARGIGDFSVLGGLAALDAVRVGIGGIIVDGAVRDIVEVREHGLAVWSAALTPTSGRHRLEAVSLNGPIACGGVQVLPGDLVMADESGIAFVPNEVARQACRAILDLAEAERAQAEPLQA